MAFNRHAFNRRLSDPLTRALMKQSMKSGPIKRPPRIKFTTTPIEGMSVSELDDFIKTGGATFGSFSPAERSAIEARLKTLGL